MGDGELRHGSTRLLTPGRPENRFVSWSCARVSRRRPAPRRSEIPPTGQGNSIICACGTSASAGGRRVSASIAARIVPTWATTSASWGPAATWSSALQVRATCSASDSPPGNAKPSLAASNAANRSGSLRRSSATGRPSQLPRSDSARSASTYTGASVASDTISAVAAARCIGEVQTATTAATRAAAASVRACTRPSSDSGGSRRPKMRPSALSAVWPCRASNSGWVRAPGTVCPPA